MGYSDLIDKLLDIRINEGMISSIGKNKEKSEDIDSLCSALLNGSLFRIPTKYIDIRDTHYYNKSPFDSGLLRYTISTESLNTQRGRDYRIYRMIKGNEYYFMITLSSVDRVFTRMKRCVIQKCNDEGVANTIWDYVNKNQLQMTSVDETLKGCKIVADTYRSYEGNAVAGSFKNKSIINDTKSVMEAMFSDVVNCMKSLFNAEYEVFIDKLYLNCTDYSVRLNGDVLTLYMNLDNVDMIHNEFKRGLGNINTDFYSLYKDNNGVGIQFFF
jgi:hypothetical protein|nr:MAG TPA: hypothetical protein [Herelleviridae sp.]